MNRVVTKLPITIKPTITATSIRKGTPKSSTVGLWSAPENKLPSDIMATAIA
jgi:hypothetical protein